MESLQDKLKSLGVSVGASHLKPSTRSIMNRIEDVIDGEELSTRHGSVFIAHHDYPPEYQHGKYLIEHNIDPNILASYTHLKKPDPISIKKIAFLDTETSGLSGGTGTIVFLIGIGFYIEGSYHLKQIFLRTPGEEAAFLSALELVLAPFDLLVTYNGKSFDVPLLNSRLALNQAPSPFSSMQHMDLLHLSRQVWKLRLSNRALSNLETEILQFYRTQEEIPGWLVPSIYFDYLNTGEVLPLCGVFYHNAMDILSLTILFRHLTDMVAKPSDLFENDLELAAIAYVNEREGKIDQAISQYQQALARDIPKNTAHWASYRLANIYKRNGDWENAAAIWVKAAENEHIESCIELAKYYEHRKYDAFVALKWANRALLLQHKSISFQRPSSRPNPLENRIERLQKKIKKLSQEKTE